MIVSWLFLLRLLTLSVMFWNMLNVAQCTTDSMTMSMPMVKIALASPALDYRYVIKSCIFKMNRTMSTTGRNPNWTEGEAEVLVAGVEERAATLRGRLDTG